MGDLRPGPPFQAAQPRGHGLGRRGMAGVPEVAAEDEQFVRVLVHESGAGLVRAAEQIRQDA